MSGQGPSDNLAAGSAGATKVERPGTPTYVDILNIPESDGSKNEHSDQISSMQQTDTLPFPGSGSAATSTTSQWLEYLPDAPKAPVTATVNRDRLYCTECMEKVTAHPSDCFFSEIDAFDKLYEQFESLEEAKDEHPLECPECADLDYAEDTPHRVGVYFEDSGTLGLDVWMRDDDDDEPPEGYEPYYVFFCRDVWSSRGSFRWPLAPVEGENVDMIE